MALTIGETMNKLIFGDCIEAMRKLPDASVDLILTDPPYGMTKNSWDSIIDLDDVWSEVKRIRRDRETPVIMFAAQPFTTTLIDSNREWFRYELIWSKDKGTDFFNANRKPLRAHENIIVFSEGMPRYAVNPIKRGAPYSHAHGRPSTNYGVHQNFHTENKSGWRYPTTVLDFKPERGYHPTQKPVTLLSWLIASYSPPEGTVLDFTMGSGSTGVACVHTGRSFIGIENDEKFFTIATNRIGEAEGEVNVG